MDGGLFGIYAGTGESEAAELIPVTLDELHKVQYSVSAAELARARAQVKAGLLMSLESTGSRCEQLARQLQVFGRVIPTAETVQRIEAVSIPEVQRAAARVFRAAPTLAAAHAISRAVSVPVLCASGLSAVTAPLAIAAGAHGVGVGSAVNRLHDELAMVAVVRGLRLALEAAPAGSAAALEGFRAG